MLICVKTMPNKRTGMEIAARAPGDGYTMLANTIMLVVNPTLFPKLPETRALGVANFTQAHP